MKFKTFASVCIVAGTISVSSLAFAANQSQVQGFDEATTQDVRDSKDFYDCPYMMGYRNYHFSENFGGHHRMHLDFLRSRDVKGQYTAQITEIEKIEDRLFVERSVLQALKNSNNANLDAVRKQASLIVDLKDQLQEKEFNLMQQYIKDGNFAPDADYYRGHGRGFGHHFRR